MSEAEGSGAATREATGAYRVLARKYRPTTFADLIGQEAMVRTVSNAFAANRIPQAWILTGVRGVGKTTTARILARALNYELPDGSVKGPSIEMPTLGLHCQAIIESRHVDVLEMDAASHNGVEDIRQINDAVRYAPVSARYKVYILDEVHMLSTAAFNALLKTLEEPPPHAKFVFATTEIRKVPVTIQSRCQRFDLRRVESDTMVRHLEGIAAKEGVSVEPDALALIARAAEGSVRDALSLLDQAIAYAAGPVGVATVRDMLGLVDRTRMIDLFDAVIRGDAAAALTELRSQYDSGADPLVVIADLADFTHFVTRVKIVPAVAQDRSLAEVERTRAREFAAALSMRVLSRAWQMLLKGVGEVQASPRPIAAAEMLLVRLAYVADLPTPDEVIRRIADGGQAGAGVSAASTAPAMSGSSGLSRATSTAPLVSTAPAPASARVETPRGAPRAALASAPQPLAREPANIPMNIHEATPPQRTLANFEDIVALAGEKRDLTMKTALERDVRLVRFEDGQLEIALEPNAPKTLVNELSSKLADWTGRRWMVAVSAEQGQPTIRSWNEARRAAVERDIKSDPLVQAVLSRFPGSQIINVRVSEAEAGTGVIAPPVEADDATTLSDDAGAADFYENERDPLSERD